MWQELYFPVSGTYRFLVSLPLQPETCRRRTEQEQNIPDTTGHFTFMLTNWMLSISFPPAWDLQLCNLQTISLWMSLQYNVKNSLINYSHPSILPTGEIHTRYRKEICLYWFIMYGYCEWFYIKFTSFGFTLLPSLQFFRIIYIHIYEMAVFLSSSVLQSCQSHMHMYETEKSGALKKRGWRPFHLNCIL
jgi:hypothetical protein